MGSAGLSQRWGLIYGHSPAREGGTAHPVRKEVSDPEKPQVLTAPVGKRDGIGAESEQDDLGDE